MNYTGEGNAAKGIALDRFVIPAIVSGLNGPFSSDEGITTSRFVMSIRRLRRLWRRLM